MGDIDLKMIYATENSNKFQKKPGLEGKKINWGCGNTWAYKVNTYTQTRTKGFLFKLKINMVHHQVLGSKVFSNQELTNTNMQGSK